MTTKYICDVCGREFDTSSKCIKHEEEHCYPTSLEIIRTLREMCKPKICDYCDHSYYVYGCEQDCKFHDCSYYNNHKNFKPVEPFHNKKECGGV